MSNPENYFNNEHWLRFSSLFKDSFHKEPEKVTLIRLLHNDISLANVIFEAFGVGSLKWITQKVPALEYITPLECRRKT
ncbi:MAG: hypothetical protein EOO01_07590 [Chitinophagaceae bacterium]|nr:MAG: hypothetical protein EOO01_07590 [Chitinophagaceae bacterium]